MTYSDLIDLLKTLPQSQLDQPITILTNDNKLTFIDQLTFTNNSDHSDDIPLLIQK